MLDLVGVWGGVDVVWVDGVTSGVRLGDSFL